MKTDTVPIVEYSNEELHLIQQAALRAWDLVALDYCSEVPHVRQDEAIEVALDADRTYDQLRLLTKDRPDREALLARFQATGYSQLVRIVRRMFARGGYSL